MLPTTLSMWRDGLPQHQKIDPFFTDILEELNAIEKIFENITQNKDVREDLQTLLNRQKPTGGASPLRCSQCGKPLP